MGPEPAGRAHSRTIGLTNSRELFRHIALRRRKGVETWGLRKAQGFVGFIF